MSKPLFAAANLDGTKGAELIIATTNIGSQSGRVLTWRKHKLVDEKGPRTTDTSGSWTTWIWDVDGDSQVGYRVFTSAGKRYVDATYVAMSENNPGSCGGFTTRSVWQSSAWKSKRTTVVPEQSGDMPPQGFNGVKLIK